MLNLFSGLAIIAAFAPAPLGVTQAAPTVAAASIADAVRAPGRPADQVARDALRKPGQVTAFVGVKPGDRVGDFMSGGGYFTRIFSRVVGSSGHVYAYLPTEELKHCEPGEVTGTQAMAHDPAYANVTILTGAADAFAAPEKLDVVFTAQNYHDLHDPFMQPSSASGFDRAAFAALKPGGVLVVIDHAAASGSGVRDTDTLHRIDPAVIVKEALAAGFLLDAKSDLLANPDDDHTLRVFDRKIRGRTDQAMLKFRKPITAARGVSLPLRR